MTITYKNDLYDIICNTEFKTEQNNFQKDLMLDFKKKQWSKDVLVFADKTTNFHEISLDQYNSFLKTTSLKHKEKPNSSPKPELIKKTRKLSKHWS